MVEGGGGGVKSPHPPPLLIKERGPSEARWSEGGYCESLSVTDKDVCHSVGVARHEVAGF